MDEASNPPNFPECLQAPEIAGLRPFQPVRGVNHVDPAFAPAVSAVGYDLAMQAMHWVSIAICLGAFLVAWRIGGAPDDEAAWLVMVHRSLSVTILALIGLRLAWRFSAGPTCAHKGDGGPAVRSEGERHSPLCSTRRTAPDGPHCERALWQPHCCVGRHRRAVASCRERAPRWPALRSSRLGCSAAARADRPARGVCATRSLPPSACAPLNGGHAAATTRFVGFVCRRPRNEHDQATGAGSPGRSF